MTETEMAEIHVFISYSHQDVKYLKQDSLFGYLKGLEKDHLTFWADRLIRTGDAWDDEIKAHIQEAHIALVLVSQQFLDSDYCQNVEINCFLAQKSHVFPILLSACDWRRHEWLSSRQSMPGGDKTVEEHYHTPGARKRLFLEIREQLRERAELIRQELVQPIDCVAPDLSSSPAAAPSYSGKTQLVFIRRLGASWRDLAMYCEIPAHEQDRFERGDEGHQVWVWLSLRNRLNELPQALSDIDRPDLVELLRCP